MPSDSLRRRSAKFVSSKAVAGTKLGRKAVLKLLGEDGEIVFNTLKDAAKIHYGSKRAAKMKQDLIKMLMKVDIMRRQNQIKRDNTKDAVPSTNKVLLQAQKDFCGGLDDSDSNKDSRDDNNNGGTPIDAVPLSNAMKEMATSWENVIGPFMKPANVEVFQHLMATLSDPSFLHALFNKPEFQRHRAIIGQAFSKVMKKLWGDSQRN